MNNLGKHHPAVGVELAAAFGMSLRGGIPAEDPGRFHSEESRGSSVPAGLPADPIRAVVADKLTRMIHIGLLDAGDPLPSERNLCEVFRVARQSVRGALGILEQRLMLAISHGRRSRILGSGRLSEVDSAATLKRLRARQPSDINQVLLVLDAEIASLSASNFNARELGQLDVLVGLQQDIARDPLCYLILDYEIRSRVYSSCGNTLLADIAIDFYGHTSPQRRQLFAGRRELMRNIELSASLAKALRERDSRQAALIMREQAEALAALPLPTHNEADKATARMDAADKPEINASASPTTIRGVFWPTASAA